jgi:hypothetical protein
MQRPLCRPGLRAVLARSKLSEVKSLWRYGGPWHERIGHKDRQRNTEVPSPIQTIPATTRLTEGISRTSPRPDHRQIGGCRFTDDTGERRRRRAPSSSLIEGALTCAREARGSVGGVCYRRDAPLTNLCSLSRVCLGVCAECQAKVKILQ